LCPEVVAKDVEEPVSETSSGIHLYTLEPVVLSVTLKYESEYPVGKVQETDPVAPEAEQEDEALVGGGIACEQDAFPPPYKPLHPQDQVVAFSTLLTLAPETQL
jgi:hypothetical protein